MMRTLLWTIAMNLMFAISHTAVGESAYVDLKNKSHSHSILHSTVVPDAPWDPNIPMEPAPEQPKGRNCLTMDPPDMACQKWFQSMTTYHLRQSTGQSSVLFPTNGYGATCATKADLDTAVQKISEMIKLTSATGTSVKGNPAALGQNPFKIGTIKGIEKIHNEMDDILDDQDKQDNEKSEPTPPDKTKPKKDGAQ